MGTDLNEWAAKGSAEPAVKGACILAVSLCEESECCTVVEEVEVVRGCVWLRWWIVMYYCCGLLRGGGRLNG